MCVKKYIFRCQVLFLFWLLNFPVSCKAHRTVADMTTPEILAQVAKKTWERTAASSVDRLLNTHPLPSTPTHHTPPPPPSNPEWATIMPKWTGSSASASAAFSRWGAAGAPQMFWWSSSSRLCLLLVSGSWREAAPSIPWCCRVSIFFGLPRLHPPGTVPCMMVFASPVARVTCPYHLSFLVLTMERRSSCGPMATHLCWYLHNNYITRSSSHHMLMNGLYNYYVDINRGGGGGGGGGRHSFRFVWRILNWSWILSHVNFKPRSTDVSETTRKYLSRCYVYYRK